MSPRRIILSAIALACCLAGGSEAQLKPAPSPEGEWAFTTTTLRTDCVLAGEMRIVETADKAFSCKFKAEWTCKARDPRSIITEQSCIATQKGAAVVVTSKLEKVTKVDPANLMELMRSAYAPDNFEVTISRRGDAMDGMFRSYDTAPVKFRRKLDLVS